MTPMQSFGKMLRSKLLSSVVEMTSCGTAHTPSLLWAHLVRKCHEQRRYLDLRAGLHLDFRRLDAKREHNVVILPFKLEQSWVCIQERCDVIGAGGQRAHGESLLECHRFERLVLKRRHVHNVNHKRRSLKVDKWRALLRRPAQDIELPRADGGDTRVYD